MRTTKKVVIELDEGETIEVVARFQRDGRPVEASATIEHDNDLGHSQLRIDVTGGGQANVLNHMRGSDARQDDSDVLDEVFFDKGISVFI